MQADTDGAEVDEHNCRLYKVARQGFPMNPQEVYDLVALVTASAATFIYEVRGLAQQSSCIQLVNCPDRQLSKALRYILP
jgi:hypothetical protein